MFAKSREWDDDFWINLVGPNLPVTKDGKVVKKDGEIVKGVDLRVETWRRLTKPEMLPGKHLDKNTPDPLSLWYKNAKRTFKTTHNGKDYYHEFFELHGHHVVDEITNIDLEMLSDPSGLLTDEKGDNLEGYMWSYTKDHAKWAISEEDEDRGVHTFAKLSDTTMLAHKEGTMSDWVCVADINRMTSQELRGGGAICFHEPLLWHCLNEIELISGEVT